MRRMYSEEQLGNVALKELQDKDLKVKTITPTEANRIYEISASTVSGRTITHSYSKLVKLGAELHCIMNFVATNNTEETIASSSIQFDFDINEEDGKKIFCADGTSLDDPYTSEINICAFVCANGSTTFLDNLGVRPMVKAGRNKIRIYILCPNLNAGASRYFSGREDLILL